MKTFFTLVLIFVGPLFAYDIGSKHGSTHTVEYMPYVTTLETSVGLAVFGGDDVRLLGTGVIPEPCDEPPRARICRHASGGVEVSGWHLSGANDGERFATLRDRRHAIEFAAPGVQR